MTTAVYSQYNNYMEETCTGPECVSPVRNKTLGLCGAHYQQSRKGKPLTVKQVWKWEGITCAGPDCASGVHARGLCHGHLQQQRKGRELTPLRKHGRTDVRDAEGRKRCSRCTRWLSESEFYPSPSGTQTRDGLNTNCNLCDRLFRYHITAAQYHEMLERQGGVCAICSRTPQSFHVDHDHACCAERKKSCGACVRGLLCPDCNGALGLMADDPNRLQRAAAYLKGVMP